MPVATPIKKKNENSSHVGKRTWKKVGIKIIAHKSTASNRIVNFIGKVRSPILSDQAPRKGPAITHPKKKVEAKNDVKILLDTIDKTNEKYKSKDLVNVIIGKENALINSHKTNEQPFFGDGKHKDNKYWMALLRQVLVSGFLKKDIETYGVIKLQDEGRAFIKKPDSFMMTEDHIFEGEQEDGSIITAEKGRGAVADTVLMSMLKDLRKSSAKKLGVPPFVIFQDPSL